MTEERKTFRTTEGRQEEARWDWWVRYKAEEGTLYLLWHGAWVLEGEGGYLQEITRLQAMHWLNDHTWRMERGDWK